MKAWTIGCKVTLRGARMYEFLDRLISLALPRVRDFRGLNPDAFDGNGNYSLGLTEQLVFPELNPDKYTRVQGMNITICCSARLERRIARAAARLRHAVPPRGAQACIKRAVSQSSRLIGSIANSFSEGNQIRGQ